MAIPAKPTVSSFPPAPLRGEDRTTFANKSNNLVAHYSTFVTEMNAGVDWANTVYTATENEANAAADSAVLADKWANQTGTTVDGIEYSSREYATGVAAPTGSSKKWATETGATVDGAEYSAKEYATGSVAESSKRWATSETEVSGGLKGAKGYVLESQGHAQDAAESAGIATSAANFKGEWVDLTGALSVPSVVYHDASYWQLLNDIADVTLSEPGVTADWAALNSVPVWGAISTNATLNANQYYAVNFTTGPLTLTLPANPAANDFVQLYKSAGIATDSIIARNGQTIMGLAEDLTIDSDITSLHLVFNGTTWRVVK